MTIRQRNKNKEHDFIFSQRPGEGTGCRWVILSGKDGLEGSHGAGIYDIVSKESTGVVHFSP